MHYLVNLVYGALDKVEGHGFHHKKLNVGDLYVADLGNFLEWDRSVILATLKDHLQESYDPDFLLKISHFFDNIWELFDRCLILVNSFLKFLDLSLTEILHHVEEPFKLCTNKGVDDIFVQKLRDIIDV